MDIINIKAFGESKSIVLEKWLKNKFISQT